MEKEEKILTGQICPYCNCNTTLVTDKDIYGSNSTYGGKYFRCISNPDHYVGTYSDNKRSLGRLADRELRQWKMKGHRSFDPLWKEKPRHLPSQATAYNWLAKKMNLEIEKTHFGMFTIEQCQEAIKHCITLKNQKNEILE